MRLHACMCVHVAAVTLWPCMHEKHSNSFTLKKIFKCVFIMLFGDNAVSYLLASVRKQALTDIWHCSISATYRHTEELYSTIFLFSAMCAFHYSKLCCVSRNSNYKLCCCNELIHNSTRWHYIVFHKIIIL